MHDRPNCYSKIFIQHVWPRDSIGTITLEVFNCLPLVDIWVPPWAGWTRMHYPGKNILLNYIGIMEKYIHMLKNVYFWYNL